MRMIVLAMVTLGVVSPVLGQQRLPRTSPSEQEVQNINRSLQNQERNLNQQQQEQIEHNQLRQELNRQNRVPNLTGPGSLNRICAPGQLGC